MGKKLRGAKLRASQRAKDAAAALQEHQAAVVATQSVTKLTDHDLFVIDNVGANVPQAERPTTTTAAATKEEKRRRKQQLSTRTQQQVDRLVKTHSPAKLAAIAATGRRNLAVAVGGNTKSNSRRKNPNQTTNKKGSNLVDLWASSTDDTTTASPAGIAAAAAAAADKKSDAVVPGGIRPSCHVTMKPYTNIRNKKNHKQQQQQKTSTKTGSAAATTTTAATTVAVDVAKSGQSYKPDAGAHRRVLQQAYQVETRRQAAQKYRDTPLSQGLSKETREFLVGDSDSEEEEEEEDINNTTTKQAAAAGLLVKREDKLTRAQRNKQKRLRQERAAIEKKRQEKKLLNQVSEIPRITKEFKVLDQKKKAAADGEKDETKNQQQQQGKDVELTVSEHDPIHAPTYPVALPSEVGQGHSLRSVKPKGNLILDRMSSLMDRQMLPGTTKKRPMSLFLKTDEDKKKKPQRRRLSVKGKKNNEGKGDGFTVLGC